MNRIKELRLNNNKTQKDIADYLGLTEQAIAYYEKGKRTPKPETWQALADKQVIDIKFKINDYPDYFALVMYEEK